MNCTNAFFYTFFTRILENRYSKNSTTKIIRTDKPNKGMTIPNKIIISIKANMLFYPFVLMVLPPYLVAFLLATF